MSIAVSVRGLTKVYEGGKVANNSISLEIIRGEIFAILGPNGAGKTTFVRQVTSELIPTSGVITLFGFNAQSEVRKVLPLVGVVPQEISPFADLTVYEHVYYIARLRGLSKRRAHADTAEALFELGLSDCRDQLVGKLSGGLKRRTIVATALTGDTKLLVLDEPTAGLDPAARRNLWRVLKNKSHEGRTIILTTHYVEEAEALADRVAIFNNGSVLLCDKPETIKSSVSGLFRLYLTGFLNEDSSQIDVAAGTLRQIGLSDVRKDSDGNLIVHVKDAEKGSLPAALDWAMKEHLEVRISPITLEDAYLELVR